VTESLRRTGGHGERWLGLDLLPSASLFERAWPRLCAGYAAEVLGS